MNDQRSTSCSIRLVLFLALSISLAATSRSTPTDVDASGDADRPDLSIEESIMVVGDADGVDAPGSSFVIGRAELRRQQLGLGDIHSMIRQIPGLNIQEEEGYGLRPNIGMRGSGSERSAKITLPEDGVLIAPAPYAAPAAYYFPTAGRMQRIEVRKGSSQIKFGPRTNGGVLNLISSAVPSELQLDSTASFGTDSTRKLRLDVGGSHGQFGWLFETYRLRSDGFKKLDGGQATGFDLSDYLIKLRFQTGAETKRYQELQLKLGRTDQSSDETYLGLTNDDFRVFPVRRYAASQNDRFDSAHRQYQLRHFIALSPSLHLTTVAYRNDFRRNWYKLQSIAGTGLSDVFADTERYARELDIARGTDSDRDEVTLRANNREYFSHGLQSVVGTDFGDRVHHVVELGVRLHADQEDRRQHENGYQMLDGRLVAGTRGAPWSQSNREGKANALALFVQDRIEWGRLSLTPGLRYENIDLERIDYAKGDLTRSAPDRVRTNNVKVLIPGLGFDLDANEAWSLFGGVHKGFSPPAPGSTEQTESEESVNYELGFRWHGNGFRSQVVGFYSDYQNLLGTDTLSAGGTGDGDLFNGGKVRVLGLEASLGYDLGTAVDWRYRLPIQLSYTHSNAEFRTSFDSTFEAWGSVATGDELPYQPRHQLYVSIGLELSKLHLALEGNYVDRMRTNAGQGPVSDHESTDSHFVFGLSAEHDLGFGANLFLDVKNLFDQSYIVARRPAGARPGLPRSIFAGIRFHLGS